MVIGFSERYRFAALSTRLRSRALRSSLGGCEKVEFEFRAIRSKQSKRGQAPLPDHEIFHLVGFRRRKTSNSTCYEFSLKISQVRKGGLPPLNLFVRTSRQNLHPL